MRFEWDPAKAATNLLKRGVSFVEASTVFGDSPSVSGRDLEHSEVETRYVMIGLSSEGRLMAVCHNDRRNVIRIFQHKGVRVNSFGIVEYYEKQITLAPERDKDICHAQQRMAASGRR